MLIYLLIYWTYKAIYYFLGAVVFFKRIQLSNFLLWVLEQLFKPFYGATFYKCKLLCLIICSMIFRLLFYNCCSFSRMCTCIYINVIWITRFSQFWSHDYSIYVCRTTSGFKRQKKTSSRPKKPQQMIHFEKKIISLNFASFCETVSRDVNVDQYCNRKQSSQLKNRHKICIGQK